jgi:hypothetical protein
MRHLTDLKVVLQQAGLCPASHPMQRPMRLMRPMQAMVEEAVEDPHAARVLLQVRGACATAHAACCPSLSRHAGFCPFTSLKVL